MSTTEISTESVKKSILDTIQKINEPRLRLDAYRLALNNALTPAEGEEVVAAALKEVKAMPDKTDQERVAKVDAYASLMHHVRRVEEQRDREAGVR